MSTTYFLLLPSTAYFLQLIFSTAYFLLISLPLWTIRRLRCPCPILPGFQPLLISLFLQLICISFILLPLIFYCLFPYFYNLFPTLYYYCLFATAYFSISTAYLAFLFFFFLFAVIGATLSLLNGGTRSLSGSIVLAPKLAVLLLLERYKHNFFSSFLF